MVSLKRWRDNEPEKSLLIHNSASPVMHFMKAAMLALPLFLSPCVGEFMNSKNDYRARSGGEEGDEKEELRLQIIFKLYNQVPEV